MKQKQRHCAQIAELALSECFRYSPEVLKGHLLPQEAVHVVLVLPITVALAPCRDKRVKEGSKMSFCCHSGSKGVEFLPR